MNGILHIIPIEALTDEDFGTSRAERFERVMALLEDRYMPPDDTIGWIPLQRAIKRNAMFSIEAESPTMHIDLRFAPDAHGGTYKIISRPRGEIEEGKVQKVIILPSDMENRRIAKIKNYQNRFLIGSSTQRHPYTRRAWIVGIDDPVLSDEK